MSASSLLDELFSPSDPSVLDVATVGRGPEGRLPITPEVLRDAPSGDLFALTQNVGMGWSPSEAARKPFSILSTSGAVRAPDGTPIALGYHTGHWEIGLLVEEAAHEIRRRGAIPFEGACSDPCDGRMQGTAGMVDSLPYRNDAAQVLRRLIRCLPTRRERGNGLPAARRPRRELSPHPELPADTRLWAALQEVGSGTWGGCVCDVDLLRTGLEHEAAFSH